MVNETAVSRLPASGYQLVLELPVSQIQLLQSTRPVFDVGKKNVPENSHKVHIEHSGDDYNQWSPCTKLVYYQHSKKLWAVVENLSISFSCCCKDLKIAPEFRRHK